MCIGKTGPMPDATNPPDATVYSVTSTTTEVPGRSLNRARHNHFVIDSPSGPGEALQTAEAFLAGIASCGALLVEGVAHKEGIPLTRLSVDVNGTRLAERPEDFSSIDCHFTYSGVTAEQAAYLTDVWKAR